MVRNEFGFYVEWDPVPGASHYEVEFAFFEAGDMTCDGGLPPATTVNELQFQVLDATCMESCYASTLQTVFAGFLRVRAVRKMLRGPPSFAGRLDDTVTTYQRALALQVHRDVVLEGAVGHHRHTV